MQHGAERVSARKNGRLPVLRCLKVLFLKLTQVMDRGGGIDFNHLIGDLLSFSYALFHHGVFDEPDRNVIPFPRIGDRVNRAVDHIAADSIDFFSGREIALRYRSGVAHGGTAGGNSRFPTEESPGDGKRGLEKVLSTMRSGTSRRVYSSYFVQT